MDCIGENGLMEILDLYNELKVKNANRNRDYKILLEKYDAKFWATDEAESSLSSPSVTSD